MRLRTALLLVLLALGIAAAVVLGSQLPAHRLLPGDRPAADAAADVRSATLLVAARAVSDLAWAPVIVPVVLLGALAATLRGRAVHAAVLVLGFVAGFLTAHEVKALVGRPRPSPRFAEVAGASFPSGHAAASIAFVALAVVLAAVLGARRGARAALVAAGVVLAIAIGLSRVELHVHYLSDVLAGWGVGTAAFALVTLLAVLVGALRHNLCPRP